MCSLEFPLHRKRQHQILQRQPRRLLARQNRLHDIRRQQRQPHHTTDERPTDLLRPGDLLQAPVGPILQQLLPPKRPSDGLDLIIVLSMVAIGAGLPCVPALSTLMLGRRRVAPDSCKRLLITLCSQRGDAPHIPELFVRQTSEIALFNTLLSQQPSEDDKQLRVAKVVFRVDLTPGFRQVFLD